MTPIDSQGMAGHIRSGIGAEPYRCFSDLLWGGSTAHGYSGQRRVITTTPLSGHGRHRRIGGARANRVYPDALLGILKSGGSRHPNDGMLARHIGNRAGYAHQPRT